SILFVFFSVTKRWSPSVLNPIWAGPTEAALRGKPLTIGLRRPFVPTRNPAIVSLPPTAAPLLSTYKTRRLTVRLMGCFPREGTVSTNRRPFSIILNTEMLSLPALTANRRRLGASIARAPWFPSPFPVPLPPVGNTPVGQI